MMRIYLANVGANAGHRFVSPIFDDGSFEFLPIPDDDARLNASPHAVRFSDLRSHYDPARDLRNFIPSRYWDLACHNDPEFETLTYGDVCDANARAAGLKRMQAGDTLLFLSRLERWDSGKRTREYGFYLVGCLRIESVLASVTQPLHGQEYVRFANNAHVIRNKATGNWNGDWLFGGSSKSRRFARAIPVTREICDKVFAAANGAPWKWDPSKSDLQTIGSYTRACRCVLDTSDPEQEQRAAILREWVARWEPELEM